MRSRSRSVLTEVLPPEATSIEAAVARYQRVAPAVTRFARDLAGDDELRVRLGAAASASPGEVVLDPGVFQAAYLRNAPVTPTEVALTSALHEVVHLLATDLDEERAVPASWWRHRPEGPPHDEEDRERPRALLDALEAVGGPPAEALFLSLEDARQERVHFARYPGAASVLADLYRAAVPEAMANGDPLGRYALACFLVLGGHLSRGELQRRLDPRVAAALDDGAGFLQEAAGTVDPWEVATIALQLLEVARLHGLTVPRGADEGRARRQAADEANRRAVAQGVDAVRLVTPALQDRESYERARAAARAVAAREGRPDEVDEAGDPATEQLVRVATAPSVYLPTGQGGKLIVTPFPERFGRFAANGRDLLAEASRAWDVAQHRVSGELFHLFAANQRRGLRSGFDAGDLSPYAALLLGAGLYERMFERRDLPTRRSYAVSLLVDGSASMLQPRPAGDGPSVPWGLAAATLGAWTLARLCDELQIEFEVAIFNRAFAAEVGDSESSYQDRRSRATGALRRARGGAADRLTRTVNHYLVKPFGSRWRSAEEVLAGLFWMAAAPREASREVRLEPETAPPVSMFEKAANVDELNLAHAAARLAARRARHRILIVLADGMTRGSVEALAATAGDVELAGTTVLGIGIGDDTVRAAYQRAEVVDRPVELTRAMVDGVRSALYRSLGTTGGDTWWAHASITNPRSVHV